MAGDLPGFSAEDFRLNIQFAMNMGLPNDDAAKPTFYFPQQVSADVPVDGEGVPFAPSGDVDRTPIKPAVRVPCAIEDEAGNAVVITAIGGMSEDRLVLTFLDTDWAKVEGFLYVALGGDKYNFVKELHPRALGPVDIHKVLVVGELA